MSRHSSLMTAVSVCGVVLAGQSFGAALDNFESYSPGNINLLSNGDISYDVDEDRSTGTAMVVNDPAFAYEGSQFMRINDPDGDRTYMDAAVLSDIPIDNGRVRFAYRRGDTSYNGISYLVYARDGSNNQAFSHGVYMSWSGELGLWTNGNFTLVWPGAGSGPFIMAMDRWYLFTIDNAQSQGGQVSFTLTIEDTTDNSQVANVAGNGLTDAGKTLFGTQHFSTNAFDSSIHNFDAYSIGAIPEPASLALLALVGNACVLRRHGKQEG